MSLLVYNHLILIILIFLAYQTRSFKFIFVLVFVDIVLLKTFVDIYSLPDLDNYHWGYLELSNVSWFNVPFCWLRTLKCPEIGFRYILKFASFLDSFKWCLFIVACFNTFAYLKITHKYSNNFVISIVIFLLTIIQSFFVIRQHTAIAFTILSFPFIIKQEIKPFLLCLLGAFLSHQSAIVFFPIYFIYGIKNRKYLIYSILGIIVFLLLFSSIIFNSFANSMTGYEGYADQSDGNLTSLIISLFYLACFVFFLKENIFSDGINKLVFLLLAINFMGQLVGHSLDAFNRLLMYYSCSVFLVIPLTMKYIRNYHIRGIYLLLSLFINVYGFIAGVNAMYVESYKLDF
ncbi:MAG: EpsG family protein [Bacteroidales bacterium]|nr:EpsG family protein [Bacteroidales bacterium]